MGIEMIHAISIGGCKEHVIRGRLACNHAAHTCLWTCSRIFFKTFRTTATTATEGAETKNYQ